MMIINERNMNIEQSLQSQYIRQFGVSLMIDYYSWSDDY